MNILTKTFKRLTGNSISYDFKEKVVDPLNPNNIINQKSFWTIYNGIDIKDKKKVTIFEFKLKKSEFITKNYPDLVQNAFKKKKIFRFLSFIKVYDFIQNENKLYIISEPVIPLLKYLQEKKNTITFDYKIFGLYAIGNALLFLNKECKSVHGSLNIFNSVFVNSSGEWKLFGFEFLTNYDNDEINYISKYWNIYLEMNSFIPKRIQYMNTDQIINLNFKLDSYLYGTFVHLILSNNDFNLIEKNTNTNFDFKFCNLEDRVEKIFNQLLSYDIESTLSINEFLIKTESFFNENKLIKFDKSMDELKFSESSDKLFFYKTEMPKYINLDDQNIFNKILPKDYIQGKLLSTLISIYNICRKKKSENLTQDKEIDFINISYIIKISLTLTYDLFNSSVKVFFYGLFNLLERSIRILLLHNLSKIISLMDINDFETNIYENFIFGSYDSNYIIREMTVNSLFTIHEKLSVKCINDNLIKTLAFLQSDPKPSIRASTVLLISNIIPKIHNSSKKKIQISAFLKSLKDPYSKSKLNALTALEKCVDTFDFNDISQKIFEPLSMATIDEHSKAVREKASFVFLLFFKKFEEKAKNISNDVDMDEIINLEFFKKNKINQSTNKVLTEKKNAFFLSNSGHISNINDDFETSTLNQIDSQKKSFSNNYLKAPYSHNSTDSFQFNTFKDQNDFLNSSECLNLKTKDLECENEKKPLVLMNKNKLSKFKKDDNLLLEFSDSESKEHCESDKWDNFNDW